MTEGVVHDASDIETIDMHHIHSASQGTAPAIDAARIANSRANAVRVELAPDVQVSVSNLDRNFYITSSCDICGKASLLALRTVCSPRVKNTLSVLLRPLRTSVSDHRARSISYLKRTLLASIEAVKIVRTPSRIQMPEPHADCDGCIAPD
jgi:FdhD protein